jgi:hypothetical protein
MTTTAHIGTESHTSNCSRHPGRKRGVRCRPPRWLQCLFMRRLSEEVCQSSRWELSNSCHFLLRRSPVEIDYENRIQFCYAACCRLRFALSHQDIEEGIVQWDSVIPILLRAATTITRRARCGLHNAHAEYPIPPPTPQCSRTLSFAPPPGTGHPGKITDLRCTRLCFPTLRAERHGAQDGGTPFRGTAYFSKYEVRTMVLLDSARSVVGQRISVRASCVSHI